MADRLLMVSWGSPVRGREERGLEVFEQALGLFGRMQQDGRIESFDVALMRPNSDLNGFVMLHGSAEQLATIQEDEEFLASQASAALIVENFRQTLGYSGEGIGKMMGIYREAVMQVPQLT